MSKYTRSDIHGRVAVLSLLKLAAYSAGSPITEIHFPARVGASYVTASSAAVKRATREFLGVKASPRAPSAPSTPHRHHGSSKHTSSSNLIDISGGGHTQALTVAKTVRGLTIYYPRLGVPHTTFSINSPRAYHICGPHGKCWWSYRMVLPINPVLGEYWGVQGTTWKDPPIIKSPSEIRTIHGRKLLIFKDGDRIRLVAWQTKDATYWISNTLLQSISKKRHARDRQRREAVVVG